MESYIVRIYRRDAPDTVSGVVEDAQSRQTTSFRSIAELTDWLRDPPRAGRRRRGARKQRAAPEREP